MDLIAISTVLGSQLGARTHDVFTRILAESANLTDPGREALVEILLGMTVAVLDSGRSETDFVSRLDRCAESLRSAGMARLSKPGD